MKQLLAIVLLFISVNVFGQGFPNNPTQSNAKTNNVFLGGITTSYGIGLPYYADTATANLDPFIKFMPNWMIIVGDTIYTRNHLASMWVKQGGSGGGGGGGSPNTSVGSGYKVAINNTNLIKSLTAGLWLIADSATANQVNYKSDSSGMASYFLRRKDSTYYYVTPTQLNTKQNTLTLTTTGSSGVATLTGATLNIPNYSLLQTGIGNYYDSVANVSDPRWGGGDGSALRLQGAIASGRSVFIPYGVTINIHDTSIQLQNYQKIFGGGTIYSSNVGTFGTYAGMFNMVKTGKYNTIDGITFQGAGKGTFITTDYYTQQNGIQITDSANLITNCLFFGIKGAGILGMYYTGSFQNNDNNIINNCRFESNSVGVYNFYGGNYQIITGCTIINNYIGVCQQTGNAKIVSTSMNYNHIGFIGEGGPADRGQITGCSLNHNDTALNLRNTSFGYLITGCTFFVGEIYLKDADKTTFSNCILATNGNVKIDGSGIVNKNVQFISCVESNTNTFVEVGTGKIIKAGVMVDNLTRFDISKTLYLRDSVFVPYIYTQSASSSDSVLVKDATTGQVKLKAQSAFGGASAISALTAATGTNTINNANYTQTWNWNSLSAASGLSLGSSSTSLSGNDKLFVSSIGAGASGSGSSYSIWTSNQAQSSGTVYGIYSNASNSSFGATASVAGDFVANAPVGSNIGGRFSASGGSTNYAIIVPASSGTVGIGTSAPDSLLTVELGAWFKRGVRASSLPNAYGDKQVRWNSSTGAVSYIDTLADFTITNGSHFLPDSLAIPVSSTSLKIRSLQAGSGITLSPNDSSVIITSSGGAGMAIGGTITSGTATRLLFVGTNGLLQQRANLTVDSSNNRMYIATSSGTSTLNLGTTSGNTEIALINSSTYGFASTTGGNFAVYQSGANTPILVESLASDNMIRISGSKFGVNSASPTSTMYVNGSLGTGYVTKTSNYTATINDYTIDCTSGSFTVSLPASSGITGRIYTIKNSGSGSITVDGNASETIDGATTYTLGTQYKYVTIQSNGSNWIVIANN